MAKFLTDEEVEQEIARLKQSATVSLARKADRLKYRQQHRRRQQLYALRDLEKRGRAMIEAGITREMLETMYANED